MVDLYIKFLPAYFQLSKNFKIDEILFKKSSYTFTYGVYRET